MSEHFITPETAGGDLLACATYLAEEIKSGEGRAQAMLAIVPLHLAKNDVDLAAELANTVDDPFTRDRLLTLVAEKCAAIDDDEYAMQLVDAIEDHGIQNGALVRIALQHVGRGNFEKAREIAAQLDHRDAIYSGIAVKESADGNDVGAAATVSEIDFAGDAAIALLTMAAAKLAAEEKQKAAEILDSAAISTEEIEHNEEKARALSDIGNMYVDADRNDKAVETFEKVRAQAEIIENTHRDGFLGAAALGFLRAGNVEMADQTLDAVSDKTQIALALLGFSREFWQKERPDDAIESLEESYAILKSQRESETRDSKARFSLYASIAAQFAGFERGDRAIEIAQEILNEDEQTSALRQIAQIMTVQKNDSVAQLALKAIAAESNRVFALIGMSDAHYKNDEKERATATLAEASAMSASIPQLAMRSSAYNEIFKRLNEFGETGKARETALLSLETAADIRDESSRAAALASLSEIYKSLDIDLNETEKEVLVSLIN